MRQLLMCIAGLTLLPSVQAQAACIVKDALPSEQIGKASEGASERLNEPEPAFGYGKPLIAEVPRANVAELLARGFRDCEREHRLLRAEWRQTRGAGRQGGAKATEGGGAERSQIRVESAADRLAVMPFVDACQIARTRSPFLMAKFEEIYQVDAALVCQLSRVRESRSE